MNNKDTAKNIAKSLLQIKAVKLRPDEPFTWASGWHSPIYCDNRLILSHPKVRTFVRQAFVKYIQEEVGHIDMVAGVATGGIAIGALVAEDLGLPFCYVRSAAKAHGMSNRIEGMLEKGQRTVVIEDLISTGKSSLDAVKALREAGAEVKALVSIFTYGFQQAADNFAAADCRMMSLSDYDTLIEYAVENEFIKEDQLDPLKRWRAKPSEWK